MGRKLEGEKLLCKNCGFMPWDTGISVDKCEHCGGTEFFIFDDEIYVKPEKPTFAETWISPEEPK